MEDFQETEGKVIGRVADIFRGNRDVKMYAIEEKMSATFVESADVLRQKVFDRDVKTHHVNMRQEAVGIVCFVLVLLVASGRYMNGHLTTGSFSRIWRVRRAPGAGATDVPARASPTASAQASLNRLNDVLMTDTSTPEPRQPMPVPEKADLILKDMDVPLHARHAGAARDRPDDSLRPARGVRRAERVRAKARWRRCSCVCTTRTKAP